jgi:type 1 fimbria pilin
MSLILSGCGSDDTSGALTMTALSSTNVGTVYTVSTKITYVPPAGKTAQGVEVTVTDSFGSSIHTLTSGSNSFDYLFYVIQGINPQIVSVEAKIGGMSASSSIVIPMIAATP